MYVCVRYGLADGWKHISFVLFCHRFLCVANTLLFLKTSNITPTLRLACQHRQFPFQTTYISRHDYATERPYVCVPGLEDVRKLTAPSPELIILINYPLKSLCLPAAVLKVFGRILPEGLMNFGCPADGVAWQKTTTTPLELPKHYNPHLLQLAHSKDIIIKMW